MTGNRSGERFIVGLDVGTTKICALAGRRERGKTRILSIGAVPSHGLRKGIVVDAGLASESIRKALRNAENTLGLKIPSVVAGIAGGHIKGFSGRGAVGVKGGVVTEDDVDRLMDSASAVYVPVDREILHVVPGSFRLDGTNSIQDPVGMPGERLEARVHIVTGSVTSVRSLVECCERAEVEVSDIVFEPLASAEAVLTHEERERGVALVDIGGGTTDIAVYRKGALRHTAVLALGGNHITNDVTVGLGISAEEGERLKKEYGHAVAGMLDETGYADTKDENGHAAKVRMKHLFEIIQPRCEELMMLVAKELQGVPKVFGEKGGFPLSSVVLTGGTSLLRGLDALAEKVFGVPVRVGIPGNIINTEFVGGPEYATGVGLLQYGLDCEEARGGEPQGQAGKRLSPGGIFERMRFWVKEYFFKYNREREEEWHV
ncbi:MAG: cell division protein FtsA [Nitrospirae bacterium]|nr:cell division protein FtsA [Nitrospirota bacterium]